jgi:polysaccharide export outer membrane protein
MVLPVLGPIQVVSRTVTEVRTDLVRRVSLFDRTGPQVTVSVIEFKSRRIFVLGAVTRPADYAFAEMPSIWEAIAGAGGPLEDADLARVEVIPGDAADGRSSTVVDVATAIRGGLLGTLPRLRPGDTVRVPRMLIGQVGGSSVLLTGAVIRPGPVPHEPALDLVTAITRGGGPAVFAKLDRVGIIRRNGAGLIHMSVNLDDYLNKANSAGNPPLEPGDTVYLPGKPRPAVSWLNILRTGITLASFAVALSANN